MTKETLTLLLLVAGVAIGILYVVRKATSNEDDWEQYNQVKIGHSAGSIRARFPGASPDLQTITDARSSGYTTEFKEIIELKGTMMFVVPSREDTFIFGFDSDGKCMYKNYRR